MKKFEIFDLFADELSGVWKVSLFQGLMLIGLGVLILLVPQLLIAMVATLFILLGFSFLVFAWKSRQFQKNYYNRFRVDLEDWV